jgi:hypothetical protein
VHRVGRSRLSALVVDNLSSYPHTATFVSSITRVAGAATRLNRSASGTLLPCGWENSPLGSTAASATFARWIMHATHQLTTGFNSASVRSSNNARHHLGFLSFVYRTKQFPTKNEVSASKWPKDNHDCTTTQTGSFLCRAREPMDIKCRPFGVEQLSKCTKKL